MAEQNEPVLAFDLSTPIARVIELMAAIGGDAPEITECLALVKDLACISSIDAFPAGYYVFPADEQETIGAHYDNSVEGQTFKTLAFKVNGRLRAIVLKIRARNKGFETATHAGNNTRN